MKKRIGTILLSLAVILSLLTACGGSAGGSSGSSNFAAGDSAASMDAPMDMEALMEPAAPAPSVTEEAEYGTTDSGSMAGEGQEDPLRDAKIIRTANLEMETTAFDESVEGLNRLTKEVGGYYQDSSLRTGGGGYRWANYTVRVPVEKYEEFLTRAGELCSLTWRSESAEDVTEAYYDTAGRLKTQQIKLERLQELLGRAEAMEDIITIESAISETEYQIESLSGTLRHYDALVDFATVNVNLQEVYKLSSVEEAPDSFGARLGSAFSNGWTAFTDWLEDLAVGLAYSWMWLIVLAVVIFVVVRVVRRKKGKLHLPTRKKKDDNPPET